MDVLRVEHVAQLVHTKLFKNPLKLLLKDLPHPQLDRIFEREVECSYGMLLSDTVHPANALLEPHRIPREIVVYDDVAELQVQPLASGLGGNEHTRFLGKGTLRRASRLEIHRTIQGYDRVSARTQELHEHRLRGNELGKDQNLQFGVVFLALETVDQIE